MRIEPICALVGASLSRLAFSSFFDPKNTEPVAKAGRADGGIDFNSRNDRRNQTGTATQTFIYRDILLNGISAGKPAEANSISF